MGTPLELSRNRDRAYATFLAMTAAAVILGIYIEWLVERITGIQYSVETLLGVRP